MTLLDIKTLIQLFYGHPFPQITPSIDNSLTQLEQEDLIDDAEHVTGKGEKWLEMLKATPLPKWGDPRDD